MSDHDDVMPGNARDEDTLARDMRVTFDTEELHAFFADFDPLGMPLSDAE